MSLLGARIISNTWTLFHNTEKEVIKLLPVLILMYTHSIHTHSMPELSGARMDRSHTWERNEA